MTKFPLIQLVRVGNMWRVYVDGVCRAFCVNFLAAQYRADQIAAWLEAQQQGGVA